MERLSPTIAPMIADDLPFVWKLLSDAAEDARLSPLNPRTAHDTPFGKYLVNWGRLGDAGVVARFEGAGNVGAAWYRLFPPERPGYGYVAPDVPELSIRLLAPFRGQGIGGSLLRALVHRAQQEGYKALSLSVNRENPARSLYIRHGFVAAGCSTPSDSSVTMINRLSHSTQLFARQSET
jgi:GNAT superfamily N-acetyltransferase